MRFEGDEGWVETGDSGEIRSPRPCSSPRGDSSPSPARSAKGHVRNFFDCVKSRARTACNADVMRRSHIACYAAAIAWQLDRKVTFDPVTETFVGDDEANRRISRATREPWSFHV